MSTPIYGIVCKKCGIQMESEYLGKENLENRMCSPCIAKKQFNTLCSCGHLKDDHRMDGIGECRITDEFECLCEKFRETSFLEAIQDKDSRLIKIIEKQAKSGQVVRVM